MAGKIVQWFAPSSPKRIDWAPAIAPQSLDSIGTFVAIKPALREYRADGVDTVRYAQLRNNLHLEAGASHLFLNRASGS
jgi:hypothetical protein